MNKLINLWTIIIFILVIGVIILTKENTKLKQHDNVSIECHLETTNALLDSIDILNDINYHLQEQHIKEKADIVQFWEVISKIESNNGMFVVGDGGKAKGSLQIHKGVITDVNRKYKTSFTHDDMFIDSLAILVGSRYLNIQAERYYRNHNSHPTTEMLARMWNGGYGLYNDEATLSYLKKFKKEKNKQLV
jgi:hypothetical protein